MKNKNLKINKNHFDYDLFCESLLAGIPKIEEICNHIDNQVQRMALAFTPFDYKLFRIMGYSITSYTSALTHYDAMVTEMRYKDELITLYQTFNEWYKLQSDKRKAIYEANIIGQSNYRSRKVPVIINSFMNYMKTFSNLSVDKLVENPYVYRLYINAVDARRKVEKKNKGDNNHDSTTNEKRHS